MGNNKEASPAGGSFDSSSNWARFTLDHSSLIGLLATAAPTAGFGGADPSAWRFDVVHDGFYVFVRSPLYEDDLPAGKSWVRAYAYEVTPKFDLQTYAQFGWYDRRGVLGLARAASGEVEVVGREALRGARTTHVRTTVELGDYEELVPEPERGLTAELLRKLAEAVGVSELPLDLWADQRGRVRRLVVSFSSPDGTVDVRARYELYDYGTRVDYGVPPASAVANAADLG